MLNKSNKLALPFRKSAVPHFFLQKGFCRPKFAPLTNEPARIVSGMQPTGGLHIGNYLGSIRNWVKLQESHSAHERFYFLADQHAFSDSFGKDSNSSISEDTFRNYALLLACGIDPNKSVLFLQSDVPMISELMWMLSCVVPFHWLNRMTQFKSKEHEKANLSLLMYPILMAADILAFQGQLVPVGNDQVQHLEFAKECAVRVNTLVSSKVFTHPKPLLTVCPRILSLEDNRVKMSKSDPNSAGKIELTEDLLKIHQKILKAKTDSLFELTADSSRVEVANLVKIMAGFLDCSVEEVYQSHQNTNMLSFKNELADIVCGQLQEVQSDYFRFLKESEFVLSCINKGKDEAIKVAFKTVEDFKHKLQFTDPFK